MKTVVGIDLGTQSLKVLFYDFSSKEVVACESAGLDLYQNDDGAAEQQAHWWLNALHEAMGKVDPAVRGSVVAPTSTLGDFRGRIWYDFFGMILDYCRKG